MCGTWTHLSRLLLSHHQLAGQWVLWALLSGPGFRERVCLAQIGQESVLSQGGQHADAEMIIPRKAFFTQIPGHRRHGAGTTAEASGVGGEKNRGKAFPVVS